MILIFLVVRVCVESERRLYRKRQWRVIATLSTYWFQAQNDPGHEMFPPVNLVQSSHRRNRRMLRS